MGTFRAWIWPFFLVVVTASLWVVFRDSGDVKHSRNSGVEQTSLVPDVELMDARGDSVRLSEALQAIMNQENTSHVLLSFWATWCPPCIKELPEFTEKREEYRQKGLSIVLINFDKSFLESDRQKVLSWMSDNKVDLITYFDMREQLIAKLNLSALPYNTLVDGELNSFWASEGLINLKDFERKQFFRLKN